jgi:hypothetical protein
MIEAVMSSSFPQVDLTKGEEESSQLIGGASLAQNVSEALTIDKPHRVKAMPFLAGLSLGSPE